MIIRSAFRKSLGSSSSALGRRRWNRLLANARVRQSSSTSSSEETSNPVDSTASSVLLKPSLNGVGQVIFLESPLSGGLVLGSLVLGNPLVGLGAAYGATVSTLAAHNFEAKDEKEESVSASTSSIEKGLVSYNGALVGCAAVVFLVGSPADAVSTSILTMSSCVSLLQAVTVTSVGVVAATALTDVIAKNSQQPQWTYAFNAVTMSGLLLQQQLSASWLSIANDNAAVADPTAMTDVAEASSSAAATATPLVDMDSMGTSSMLFDWMTTATDPVLHGVSQIFLVENSLTGLGILGATFIYSPQLALHAVMGSALGSVTGYYLCLGGELSALPSIAAGLYGYNAALSSMAVAVFAVPNTASRGLAASAAVASTLVCHSMMSLLPVPCLTLPFCVTLSALYPLLDRVPGLERATNPHSPERNAKED